MKENLSKLSFELPSELLEAFSNEEKPERALNQVFVEYKPKHPPPPPPPPPPPELLGLLVGNTIEEAYREMGRINLGMAEMGLVGDVCCLQDYEDILRDDADDAEY